MARLYVCYGVCNKKHEKEALINHNGKNYCKDCYDKKMKENNDRVELYNYIKEIYSISFPTGYMLKSIKQFQDDYGYKLKGIYLTLKYCKEIKKMSFNPKMGLGIVPYEYENAKAYWIERNKKMKAHKDVEIKPETVVITGLSNKNHFKDSKLISWEGIL